MAVPDLPITWAKTPGVRITVRVRVMVRVRVRVRIHPQLPQDRSRGSIYD